ncbi:Mitochondrial intermediate peptidase [Coemansia sp. RSA 1813]|nr:Mitochondrial intermediate peptidase [Coemansia sp. RSA 1646]KAJ1768697.1 Mitochondrial intermediate peptidase [Coemansia sp. RSA 1843]KAJ2093620.1 Mitochondrial intermediate peptidase [Coemansia sp. RSA 986]KAJ2214995.1 Mitochondrial intermediate peptidase [Coemansia sp. RSA 487]KAJ2565744.1 Mitochondrial intermediate peptidase [Coemansia sp. RSA 1813]
MLAFQKRVPLFAARNVKQKLLTGVLPRCGKSNKALLQTLSSVNAHTVTKDEELCLRDVFDLPTQTTVGSQWYHRGKPTGLLMESRFLSPKSFRAAGKEAVAEAQALVQKVVDAKTTKEKRQVIKCLDQLSDALCRVMDVAELVRQVHPDSNWQAAADQVYSTMLDYMNGLNTHVGLYRKLVEVIDDSSIKSTFSTVELAVAESFRRDFERSGIHLAKYAHERFVELSSSIHDLSRDFIRCQSQLPEETRTVDVPLNVLRTLPSPVMMYIMQTARTRKRSDGTAVARIVPDGYIVHFILRDCEDSDTREAVYCMWQRGSSGAVNSLEQLLEDRLSLSHTVGFDSFAHMSLDDKMARSPAHVDEFLRGLAAQAKPQWSSIIDSLMRTQAHSGQSGVAGINPWDRDYWVSRQQMDSGALPSLSPYFSLGRVVLGLSRVFKSLYGVEFRATTPQPGEIWHPDVRKLEVVDENGRLQGIIYCDVFTRNSKAHIGAAHFTARCARRVDDDIAVSDAPQSHSSQTVVEKDGKRFQLPVVVLICDFPLPAEGSPPLLSWSNVETIFHEMGHAMHSMLGQNGFHNVAGTRCPVDFVELPSILMEHFARSPQVLSTFASNYETGAPLPTELIAKHAERRRKYAALDLHTQLFMSALDQRYHSKVLDPSAGNGKSSSPGWSTRSLASVSEDPMFTSGIGGSKIFNYVQGTRWQSRFTHLIGYGASYYAYLFDRVLAGQIWDRVFQGDKPFVQSRSGEDHHSGPLNREAGERFKNEVLRWGGGRDPWQCVAAVLDNGKTSKDEVNAVAQGSKTAMRIVGSWRLPDL